MRLVPRPWLDDQVDAWLGAGKERILYLGAGPGFGKSVYAALLVERLTRQTDGFDGVVIAHICRAQDEASIDPLRFVEALSNRLARDIDEFRTALEEQLSGREVHVTGTASVERATGSTVAGVILTVIARERSARRAFDYLVRKPLETAYERGARARALVVVDGLDEALGAGGDETIADVLKPLLSSEDRLPQAIRFFLTFREEEPRLAEFRKAARGKRGTARELVIQDRTDQVDGDITRFLEERLEGKELEKRREVARRVAELAKGNFLFAHHLLLEVGKRPQARVEELEFPHSLTEVYERFLARELAADELRWLELHRRVAGLIAVSRGDGLTRQELQTALGMSSGDLAASLLLLFQFLEGPERDGPFRFFHQSFREFLLAPGDPKVDAAEANATIARYLIEEHDGAWSRSEAAYARSHLPEHLLEATRLAASRVSRKQLLALGAQVLGAPDFVKARIATAGPAPYARDVARFQKLPDFDALDAVMREKLGLLAEMVRISGHILALASDQFTPQLWARIPPGTPAADQLRRSSAAAEPGMWLRPRNNCALIVGTPLRRMYDGKNCVNGVVVSRSGGRMALGNDSADIVVYDTETGHEIKTIETGAGWVSSGAAFPDGRRAVFGFGSDYQRSNGGALALDLETLEVLWKRWGADANEICVSLDGQYVVCVDRGNKLVVLSAANGETVLSREIPGVESGCVLSDNRTLLMSTNDAIFSTMVDAEPSAGGALTRLDWIDGGASAMLALDDRRLAIGRDSGAVLILDFASRTVRAVGSHTSAVSALAWDERATLFSGAHDATFSAWDLDAGEQRFGYEGHTMKVYALCYAAGMIYTGSKDSTVKSWDVAALARGAPKLRLASTVVQTLAVSPDGRFVTYSDTEDQILIQPTSDLSALASAPTPVRAHRGKILALAFDEKSERLASIGADGMLKVWRIAGEPTLEKRIGFGRTERDFEARIDFATATGVIWNTELFELIRWERSNSFEAIPIDFKGTVALCPDGRHVLGSIEDVGLALVDLDREKVVQVLRPASKPRDDSERAQMEAFTENWLNIATVSASGGVALTACSGRITRWRLSDGAPMAGAVPEHIAHIHGLAVIEPLHAGLSIGLEDRELRLWSLDDGTLLCRFVADGGWWASDVSRDGRVIVASNEEGLMVFDVVGGARA